MLNRRPYIAESVINPGCGVAQGSGDNKVKTPDASSDRFIGVYAFEANEAKEPGDRVGIVLAGVVKVLLAGNASAGKQATLSIAEGTEGGFLDMPESAGTYAACGLFLESGVAGDYVDMMVERGSVTVA